MYSVVHAIFGYFYLLLTIRVLSRRPGAQMTLSDFVLVFLLGGIIILATMGDDRSVTNSVCVVLTVGLLHRWMSYLKIRYLRLGAIVDGVPLVLLKSGEWQTDIMQRMGVQDIDVMGAARTKGLKTLRDIKYAILERNGGISIIEAEK